MRCRNDRCWSNANGGFCKDCQEAIDSGVVQVVVCKECGMEFRLRKRLFGEDERDIGICNKCKEEIDIRRNER